jgi:hypothetical protein
MSPSSPSNADSAGGTDYKVSSRALAADLAVASIHESARDLGSVDTPALVALLEKLAALDASAVAEADPQLVVTARRGRFTIRPGRGRLLLRLATGGDQSYWELTAAEVPGFLDGRELPNAPSGTPDGDLPVEAPVETRLALALTLFAATFLIVAASAWLTFRPDDVDPAALYGAAPAPAEAAAAALSAAGTYVNGGGDDERVLEIAADGTVHYREYGPGREVVDERRGQGNLVHRLADRALVLRVPDLGPIELKPPNTVIFARDTYQRRTSVGTSPP